MTERPYHKHTERHCAASRRFSGKRIQPRWTPCLSVLYLRCMSSVEEYRKRAKEARQQADTSCIELERQGLLIIADQYERIASYKDLTNFGHVAFDQGDTAARREEKARLNQH